MNNGPLFTETLLIPSDLELTIRDWHKMPIPEFEQNTEIIRMFIIEKVFGIGHDFFNGNMSPELIIINLNKIITDSRTIFIDRPYFKRIQNRKTKYWNGILKYNSQLTRPINHWFPELSFAKGFSGTSITEQFYDKVTYDKNVYALLKRDRFKILAKNPNKITSKLFIEGLRLVNGNQPIQNFPVGVAKWLYLNYAQNHLNGSYDFYILDQCMGWGSRLVAAMAACSSPLLKNVIVHYYGTEVNSSILERYKMLVSFWKEKINPEMKFILYHPSTTLPFEDIFDDYEFNRMKGKFDLAFTSPPYFSTEKYSEDEMQSYKRYPLYDSYDEFSWKDNFLKKLISNTYELLKEGGFFYLNIAEEEAKMYNLSKPIPPLINDSMKLAKEIGFNFQKRYGMEMPSHSNFSKEINPYSKFLQKRDGKKHRYEPILLFIK